MDLDLLHPLVENAYAATIPADPDLVANELGGYFVEGAAHFDVTVAVDVAPGFLVGGKKRVWKWLKMRTFLLKTGHDLFTRRAMDTLVGDTAFPVTKKEVFFTQRLEAPVPSERWSAHMRHRAPLFLCVEASPDDTERHACRSADKSQPASD